MRNMTGFFSPIHTEYLVGVAVHLADFSQGRVIGVPQHSSLVQLCDVAVVSAEKTTVI